MIPIVLAYIASGLNRGAMLCQLTTVTIFMYTKMSKYKYTITNHIISLLSIASCIGAIIGTISQPKLVRKFGRYATLQIVAVMTLIMNALTIP